MAKSPLSTQEENILTVLLGAGQDLYGLNILNQIRQISAHSEQLERLEIVVGSLYPTLKRLEKQGFIQGRWGDDTIEEEGSAQARRRYYIITGKGEQALKETWEYRKSQPVANYLGQGGKLILNPIDVNTSD
jgi:PadR family transcriptional regulator, regulatory protein PadR